MRKKLQDYLPPILLKTYEFPLLCDTEQPEIKGSSCGLVGMQERASVIGARLAMESDEHGTKMTLVAPMHVAEGKEAGA